jgi:hypothetical protein
VSGHPAKLVGADTVLSNCRGPLEDEFVSTACVPGDAVTKGKDTLLTRCSPIPPDSYVSLACKAGDPYHEGHDLVSSSCSEPEPGTYVIEICKSGTLKVPGSDTKTKVCSKLINPSSQYTFAECTSGSAYALGSDAVFSNCRDPLEDEYVSTACVPGDALTVGRDTHLTRCSPIPSGSYVSLACKAGDPYHEGNDLVSSPCSDPQPGTYVIEICKSGTLKVPGSDTKTKVCSKLINPSSQVTAAECTSGSAYALGSDAVIKPSCAEGWVQDSSDPLLQCVKCPDNKSTLRVGMETCDICIEGFTRKMFGKIEFVLLLFYCMIV